MKCFKCGSEIPDGWQFCGNCGIRTADPQSTTMLVEPTGADELLQKVRMVLAGEYEVAKELARGGMAVVFEGTEVALHRPVALKVLPPDATLTTRAAERFKREARMAAELDHPNIVPVYRVGQVGGIFHIAMKLVQGRSLQAILEAQGALAVPVALNVLRSAARALTYAHERHIVHRDIKGANILVDQDGRVMLSDFGVALRASDVTLTADGAVIGTPPFMSPEQCAGARAGPQSDQYSLGIVAFQMLTGAVPFQSETLAGMMQHHFFTTAPDVRAARDDIPEALAAVLSRALAKDPAARYLTTGHMLSAIEAISFSEADRQESRRLLRELAQGSAVGKVATRSLPLLPDARTVAMAAGVPRASLLTTGRAAGIVALAVLGAGGVWWLNRADGAARPVSVPTAPVALPAAPPAVPRRSTGDRPNSPALGPAGFGRLRLLTTPPDAEILIDGRPVGVGSVFDLRLPVGARQLSVRARGYRTLDTTLVSLADSVLSLGRITLRAGESP